MTKALVDMAEPEHDVTFRTRILIKNVNGQNEEKLPEKSPGGKFIRYEVIEGITEVSRPKAMNKVPERLTPIRLQEAGANELPFSMSRPSCCAALTLNRHKL